MRLAGGILALVLMSGCVSLGFAQFPPDTGVVFAGEAAHALEPQCSRIRPGPVDGVWTPNEADIAALETKLLGVIAEHARQVSHDDQIPPLRYYRQYGGLVIGGRRIIYVNGFDRNFVAAGHPAASTWRTTPIGVCHGGTALFGVEYDPATGSFANFAFSSFGPP